MSKDKKLTKDEMIAKLEKEIEEIKKRNEELQIAYHQKTGALAYLKEIE
tara:strand:- start:176 stop:322 length:147 start_codon:yes stop_codon:yes gene_type:complete